MISLASIPLKDIRGKDTSLAAFAGQVLLVVNVASQCGFTPQYEGLKDLHQRYAARGFTVLGFPTNDFAGQEPGNNEEIEAFCQVNFGIDFPMFGKIVVVGPDQHPLYDALTGQMPACANDGSFRKRLAGFGIEPNPRPEILWNFEKFLISRMGEVVARFAPDTEPGDPALVAAIEAELSVLPTSGQAAWKGAIIEMTDLEEQNLALVQTYMTHIAANEIERALALCGSETVFRGPDGALTNKDGLRAMFAMLAPLMPNPLEMTTVGSTVQGNRVALEATARTQLANGNEYANIYHFIFEVEDGLIVASREYCDTSRAAAFA